MATIPSFDTKLQLQLLPTTTTPPHLRLPTSTLPRLRSHQARRDIPFASRRVDGAEADGVVGKIQECCDGTESSTRSFVTTFRTDGSNPCPASAQPIRRPMRSSSVHSDRHPSIRLCTSCFAKEFRQLLGISLPLLFPEANTSTDIHEAYTNHLH